MDPCYHACGSPIPAGHPPSYRHHGQCPNPAGALTSGCETHARRAAKRSFRPPGCDTYTQELTDRTSQAPGCETPGRGATTRTNDSRIWRTRPLGRGHRHRLDGRDGKLSLQAGPVVLRRRIGLPRCRPVTGRRVRLGAFLPVESLLFSGSYSNRRRLMAHF